MKLGTMAHRRRTNMDLGIDLWPVVADSFIGILGVYIFVTLLNDPVDPEIRKFRDELSGKFKSEIDRGLLVDFSINNAEACIVYSADALSFQPCEWNIPDDKAERIREHLRWFGVRSALIKRIQIEGHADVRGVDGCLGIGPYRDNLQLSQNRARAIYNTLLGLAASDRFGFTKVGADAPDAPDANGLQFVRALDRAGKLQTAGFGDRRPRDAQDPTNAENRRVEIRIIFSDTMTP